MRATARKQWYSEGQAAAFATGVQMSIDMAALSAADFTPRLNEQFRIVTPGGPLDLKLIEVRDLGVALRKGGAFALTFLSPPGPFLQQATYPLENSALGTLDLFIVPLGPKDGRNSYEAVFT
jgi:hypothetical protein